MATFRLKYTHGYIDRHGKLRTYFRRVGFPSLLLPGLPGSAEFMAAYAAALKGTTPAPVERETKGGSGSINALIALYYSTNAYKNLQPITQKNYRSWLERFRAEHGHRMAKTIERNHIAGLLDALSGKPGAQKSMRRMLSILMMLAVERNWRTDNPLIGLRKSSTKTVSTWRSWTEEDIATFEGHWASGTRERLAFALLLYTAQRRSDVVSWGRQHIRGGAIHTSTSKSNNTTILEIPIHPALHIELELVPKTQLQLLQTLYGHPFTPEGFGGWFKDVVRASGITEQASPHGLRKASLRRLAEAGCTPHQIMAISGHKNLAEVTLYTAASDQKKLAQEAIGRIGS